MADERVSIQLENDDRLEPIPSDVRVLDDATIATLAADLRAHELSATSRPPLTTEYPDMSIEDAYQVQRVIIAGRLESGARFAGRKVGATNPVIQKLFGFNQPDYGVILDDMVLPDGARVATSRLIQPMVEPEVGFILSEPLSGPGITPARVMMATGALFPCLEIIDSRITDWKIKLADTIADNGSDARVVLGDRTVSPAGLDLRTLGVVLERNGEVVATGAGAAVLGHPAASVAWLANMLGRRGERLEAGQLILAGALTTALRAHPGDYFQASFAGIGRASCRFL